MVFIDKDLQFRNREIGQLLREARTAKAIISVSRCARLIGTSRRRYLAMEAGETIIGAAEFETLVGFLEISANKIWHGQDPLAADYEVTVPLAPQPGDSIVITLRFQVCLVAGGGRAGFCSLMAIGINTVGN